MTRNSDPDLPEFVKEARAEGPASSAAAELRLNELLGAKLPLLLQEVPPSDDGRARLLEAVRAPARRYAPFSRRLSDLFDLVPERVEAILTSISSPGAWVPGPVSGVELMHFDGGPSLAGADTGLVRMPPNFAFPRHTHTRIERVFILHGGYRDDAGKHWLPGDLNVMPPGTSHEFTTSNDGLLFALVLVSSIPVGDAGPFA